METFREKSAPRLVLVRDSGFTEEEKKKMMMMMNNYDDTKIVKSRMTGFSRDQLEAGRNELGLYTARYESKSCCWCVLKA